MAFVIATKASKSDAERAAKSFENPLYEAEHITHPSSHETSNQGTSGYMDIPSSPSQPSSGYMDIEPFQSTNNLNVKGDDDEDEFGFVADDNDDI